MAPGGAWYNDRLEGSVAVVVGSGCGCGGSVSRLVATIDKNDNFACHVSFAG
jgi:hypothetical protein